MTEATSYRQYAYFSATGLENPEPISKLLKIQPTDSWRAGDEYERHGNRFKRIKSLWRLDSGLQDTEALSNHIRSLLSTLTPHKNSLLDLGGSFKLQIVCVSMNLQSFSWELEFDAQRIATSLGIGFWIDAYSFIDPHEEMTDLRERLGIRPDGTR